MADFFDEDLDEEFKTVTMTDEDGVDIEFCIIDQVMSSGERYLLVVESELMDDEETEAIILKEISINEEDVTYALVEDDAEFNKVADLFAENDGEYDIEVED